MKTFYLLITIIISAMLLNACGGGGTDGIDEVNDVAGNDGNDGKDGVDGQDGKDGIDGEGGDAGLSTLVLVTEELAGGNCAQGGQKIETGVDDNRDGVLDVDEIDQTSYVCGDITAPVLTPVTSVDNPARTFTPSFTFNSSETGRIRYQGTCISDTNTAQAGDNTIVFNKLDNGFYNKCAIRVEDPFGNTSTTLRINKFKVAWLTKPLNDTGTTECGNFDGSFVNSNSELECSIQPVVPTQTNDGYDADGYIIPGGQDALYGRDFSQDDDGDGHAGFSYTKIDSSGVPLADQSQNFNTNPWTCVKDNVTGLIWEVKTTSGLQSNTHLYTWYNSTGVNDGGDHGVGDTGLGTTTGFESGEVSSGSDDCGNAARCDTEKYTADVNALNICGETNNDWRLPNYQELLSIVNYNGTNPAIDVIYFPNSGNSLAYWSSTPYYLGTSAWHVNFSSGYVTISEKNVGSSIRLVRTGN